MAKADKSFIIAHTDLEGRPHASRVSAPDADTAREKLVAAHTGHMILGVHDDDGREQHAIGAAMFAVADLGEN